MLVLLSLASAVIHVAIALFQLLLVLGKPYGEYAWGGQHVGVLPRGLRIGSGISFLLLLFFASINLHVAGWLDGWLPGLSVRGWQWVVLAYAALGAPLNAISRSRKERRLWTPVVSALFVLNALALYLSPD